MVRGCLPSCGIFLAGLAAGVVFLGAGSRIVMRLAAILDSDTKGLVTEAENVVG